MEKNVKLFYNAIQEELRGCKEIKLDYTLYAHNNNTIMHFNGTARINLGYESKWSDHVIKNIEDAIKEVAKADPYWSNIHPIYFKKENEHRGYIKRISLNDWREENLMEDEMVMIVDKHGMCSKELIYEAIAKYPNYELQIQSGFGWKGAKPRRNCTMVDLRKHLSWAVAQDLEIDHVNKVVFVNGFGANDMW